MKLSSILICAALLVPMACAASAAPMRAVLTPEERALYVQQTHGPGWRSLNVTQRCARMEQVRRQWRSMSPAARNQLKQQLASRWQAMPAADRQRIEHRIADRQARRAQNSAPRHGARCAAAGGSAL